MTENYHTHTYRCHHAMGSDRQYVERAIAKGIQRMGFSDHSPFREPSGKEQTHRIFLPDVPFYFDSLKALREEFRDQIELFIGFEMEYYPIYFEQMLETACACGAEYLILGQHWIRYGEKDPYPYVSSKATEEEADLACYVDTVIGAMQTGVFSYVAHPDLFKFVGDDAIYERQMRRLCQAANQYDIPLEINFLGIRDGRNYPNEKFWRIVGEEGCEVVFGCDAHQHKHAYDEESDKIAQALVAKYHLRYNPHPMLVDPRTKKKFRHLCELEAEIG